MSFHDEDPDPHVEALLIFGSGLAALIGLALVVLMAMNCLAQ